MVLVSSVKEKIEALAPTYLKEDFDNVGLLFGRNDKNVKKVILALDTTEEVVDKAIEHGADMIICHHPLIFNPLKAITSEDEEGRCLLKLGMHDIAVYSAHTNLDKVKGGLNDLFLKKLSLPFSENLEGNGVDEGIGRISVYETTLFEMLKKVKEAFDLPVVRYSGNDGEIKKIAVCTGSGRSLVSECIRKKCDLYITGELHHSDINELLANNICYIEVTHFDSEIIVREIFSDIIKKSFPEVEILLSDEESRVKYF